MDGRATGRWPAAWGLGRESRTAKTLTLEFRSLLGSYAATHVAIYCWGPYSAQIRKKDGLPRHTATPQVMPLPLPP